MKRKTKIIVIFFTVVFVVTLLTLPAFARVTEAQVRARVMQQFRATYSYGSCVP